MTDHPIHENHAIAGYFGAWRLSLRLARRDIRRHRGRALLVVLLVGLPLLIVAAGATFAYTRDVSSKEGLTRTMGAAQAYLYPVDQWQVRQSPDGSTTGGDGLLPRASTLPGARPGRAVTAAGLQGVTGGEVLPVSNRSTRVQFGDRKISAQVLGIDGRNPAYRGMARRTTGRWPTTPDEVLVTRAGKARGIPSQGRIRLSEAGKIRAVTVVGTAAAPGAEALVALPVGADGWLLKRDTPVDWAEVKQLNRYGLVVQSRSVIEHPSQAANDGPAQRLSYDANPVPASVWTLLAVGLVIVIAMLAGPAFGASASRQRHALGLLVSNGATRPQLRRYLLGQALLLGAISALVSIVAGAVVGWAAIRVHVAMSPTAVAPGPLELRWRSGVLLLLIAIVASLVAAYIPAVAAARLRLIEVLRGQVSPRTVRAGWPVAGVVLAAGGAFLLWVAIVPSLDAGSRNVSNLPIIGAIGLGAAALFGGVLMTTPWLLAQLGRAAGRFPLAIRLAARDVSRQRGRAVATTAAILGTAALCCAALIGYATVQRDYAAEYTPQLPMGQASVDLYGDSDAAAAERVVQKAIPRAEIAAVSVLGSRPTLGTSSEWGVAMYSGTCTDQEAMQAAASDSCHIVSSPLAGNTIVVGDVDDLARVFRLSDTDRRQLRDGRLLLPTAGRRDGPTPMHVVTGTVDRFGDDRVKVAASKVLPAIASTQSSLTYAAPKDDTYVMSGPFPAGLATPAAVRGLGAVSVARLVISAPGGVSADAQRTIAERIDDADRFCVERGYQDDNRWVFVIIGAVFGLLLLVATLVSTAMSQAESRADSATLASIGAPGRTRRAIAASNAAVVGLVGALLGLVVGLVPGIAAARALTGGFGGRSAAVIPWGPMLAVVLGVPLLAAILAGLVTRGRPPMTRRTT
ncbi:FtsX-like permease family protein [Flexivirga meconopsidis]|uniref:FtsX-like permease family protein n=1 Tax=Flexivirga meconopsidis TaxID=2977121 RepID=UPI00223F2EA2|nr:FtsX-like permease family protein [Flexivirga meconopsidis]